MRTSVGNVAKNLVKCQNTAPQQPVKNTGSTQQTCTFNKIQKNCTTPHTCTTTHVQSKNWHTICQYLNTNVPDIDDHTVDR